MSRTGICRAKMAAVQKFTCRCGEEEDGNEGLDGENQLTLKKKLI